MKLCCALLSILLFISFQLKGYPAKYLSCYVIVSGKNKIASWNAPAGTECGIPSWAKADDGKTLVIKRSADDSWQELKFNIVPEKDGIYLLRLMSLKREGVVYGIYYDNIKLNGQPIPNGDFEQGEKYWLIPYNQGARIVSDPAYTYKGNKSLLSCYSSTSTRMKLIAGKKYEISMMYRSGGATRILKDVTPLDLSKTVNMDYKDEISGDGKGGWSDQGKDRDLRDFDHRMVSFGGMEFKLIDPEKNNNKALITFNSAHSKTGLKEVVIDMQTDSVCGKYLYLLHTSAWTPRNEVIGDIIVSYKDGSSQTFTVSSNRECGDWESSALLNNGKIVYTRSYKDTANAERKDSNLFMSHFALQSKEIKNIMISGTGKSVWMVLATSISNRDVPFKELKDFELGEDWKAADFPSPQIPDDSILNFSSFMEKGPAGQFGRVIKKPDGTLEFEKRPGKTVRFLGSGCGVPVTDYKPFHDRFGYDYDKFCELQRRQGYNIIRIYPCSPITELKENGEMPDIKWIDFIDKIIAIHKKHGIYSNVVMGIGSMGRHDYGWMYKNDHQCKLRLYLKDTEVLKWWKHHTLRFLNRVNPYTGIAYKDDPSIVCLDFYNEPELGISFFKKQDPEYVKQFKAKWQDWLQQKYINLNTLNTEWKDNNIAYNSFEHIDFPSGNTNSQMFKDWGLFIADISRDIMLWWNKIVRDAGYKGFVSTFNYGKGIQDSAVRAEVCDMIEVNTYHSHPSTGLVNKNTYVPQKSAVVNDVPHFRMAAGCRQAGLPLLITEQNHCFWNRYLYENGIAFSSYSALQNFSGIMVHCIPVSMNFPVEHKPEDGKLHLSKLQPFTVTQNPLFRANEFMAACLYLRGDVRPSPHRIDLSISNKYLLQTGKNVAPNTEQVKLALLCGFALDFPDAKRIPALSKITPASMTIHPAAGASIRTEEWFTEIYDNKTGGFHLDQMIEELKRKGILPQDNKTDSDAGIFQSDTGEIMLHSKAGMMSVTTPKSEGANLFAGNTCTLSVLDIKNTDRDAAIFVTSMDKNDLSESSKVVLVYSTEEMNTGMKLSPDRTICLEPGRHPCLLLTGKLEVELALKPAKWSLYALSVNGIRRENLPLSYKNGKIKIKLDTASLKNGVTPFFELAAE